MFSKIIFKLYILDVINPIVSKVSLVFKTPVLAINPKEGFIPHTPQKLAGLIMEPAVCDARANGTSPVQTAVAEPLEDVPGVLDKLCGFFVSLSL